ncbi:GntR family transcriptional regulator [Vibrio sp. SCSIO 43137]|uniref:GntR family transcriptional regulator n=1 Tax=Vibrio sp. SCSIO 43137 TaxID=3021011 RepID=UPI0023081D1E|nr:GntR family transcriptional regulator [Vibrio sp. SCSIO 43137]WCE32027.1 GntR family transcriptional regulator [Vibrio sp. SCSIO 43137]
MAKFNKSSLEVQAVDYLRDLILTGSYKMGEKIVESALAKELELSRSTIRMALNTLSHEGLVVQKPYVGWQVIEIDEHDVWEIYHLRIAIESRSAWLAATKIDDDGKAKLRQLINEFTEEAKNNLISTQRKSKFELEFHSLIVSLSDNGRLMEIYRKVSNQMLLFFNIDLDSYEPLNIVAAHQPLVDAICNNDPQSAAIHAEQHISTFKDVGKKLKERQR